MFDIPVECSSLSADGVPLNAFESTEYFGEVKRPTALKWSVIFDKYDDVTAQVGSGERLHSQTNHVNHLHEMSDTARHVHNLSFLYTMMFILYVLYRRDGHASSGL